MVVVGGVVVVVAVYVTSCMRPTAVGTEQCIANGPDCNSCYLACAGCTCSMCFTLLLFNSFSHSLTLTFVAHSGPPRCAPSSLFKLTFDECVLLPRVKHAPARPYV